MSENPETNSNPTQPAGESWKEVGHQFEVLGESLAQAFRSAWGSIENKTEAQQVKDSLESMVRQVGAAIEDTVKSPEGQKIKEDAKKTAETIRSASEKAVIEARPQIISALQKANEELKKLLDKLAQSEPPKSE